MSSPRRVAILGGGIAGLAAAWELSRPGDGQPADDVTVYQRGWRLGGKGASSRGIHGRIEEHGLHVWLGYYENAFRLMRECYRELDRPHRLPHAPITTWDQAFRPASTIGLGELHDGEWLHWLAEFDEDPSLPGEVPVERRPLAPAELVDRSVKLLLNFGESLRARESAVTHSVPLVLSASPVPPASPPRGSGVPVALGDAALVAALASLSTAGGLLDTLRRPESGRRPGSGAADVVLDAVDAVVQQLRTTLAARARRDDAVRRSWQFVDLVGAIVRGIVVDRLLERPEGYAAVDDVDYREWLTRHGASPDTIASPLVRVVYDLVFGYEHGEESRPSFSAGTGLLLSGKMFFEYRGAIFWKMTAGMGDVVFAPLHDALRARGVRFRFFHRVDRLRLNDAGTRIDAVDLGVQVRLRGDPDTYEPLVEIDGLPCWPTSPRVELLDASPSAALDTLESHWSDATDADVVTIRDGHDFDDLVLAIPVGMHRFICAELIANPRTPQWRAMSDGLATVATQTMQLWLAEDERALGWSARDVTTSGYPGAFHTYAAMSDLIDAESWPPDERPAALAYFCHVLPTGPTPPAADAGYPARELERVRAGAVRYLTSDVVHLWPASRDHAGFRWDLLAGSTATGEARLDDQYLRANVDPSDRYVLSLPGTGRFRLRPDASGYENLRLAGDWTDNGLNAGCIEAAVVSGIQAANAVRGRALLDNVAGYYPTHARFEAPASAADRP